MATNYLVGFGILHNIPKDWLLEFFGGVAAGIPKLLLLEQLH
jgi:uncharacterized membrane protein SpoIIM required for sporulation